MNPVTYLFVPGDWPDRYGKAATELPALLSLLLQKLPPEIAGQVVVAWGILPDTPYHARGLHVTNAPRSANTYGATIQPR